MDCSDGLRFALFGPRSVESHVQPELPSRVLGSVRLGAFTSREAMFSSVLCKYGKTLVDWRMAIHGTSDANGPF